MKIIQAILFIMIINSLNGEEANKYKNFWRWFEENQSNYYDFQDINADVEKSFDSLAKELCKVNKNLTFEFGPKKSLREFVISADGIKSAFPDVIELVKAAPALDKWKVVQFRPRRTLHNDIILGNIVLKSKETFYTLYNQGDKIGLILYNDHYSNTNELEWKKASYLLLDETLGEYDVETKVGSIDFVNPEDEKFKKYYNKDNGIEKMPESFDEMWEMANKSHKRTQPLALPNER